MVISDQRKSFVGLVEGFRFVPYIFLTYGVTPDVVSSLPQKAYLTRLNIYDIDKHCMI